MAVDARRPTSAERDAQRQALAAEWRRLARGATLVAILTSPATFALLHVANDWPIGWSIVGTILLIAAFRGLIDVVADRFVPRASLYGAGRDLLDDDIVSRRRLWWWRSLYRRLFQLLLWLGIPLLILYSIKGTTPADIWNSLSTFFSNPQAISTMLILGLQIPLLFFTNLLILFGPLLFFGLKQMKGYEPGDADWGVKLADVRGQAEPKQEVTRVISLWQSGEAFRKAGGKPERGLLFLGAPGTGKTMLSKGIATSFNSPIVTMPGSGFAQTFIGMDVIIVQFLLAKARRLARKWGGQCIVFIDEIDAVGRRRQGVGSGTFGFSQPGWVGPHQSTTISSTAAGARSRRPRTSSGRRPNGASASSRPARPSRAGLPRRLVGGRPHQRLLLPRRHDGRHGRRPGAEPAAGPDGRHRRAAVLPQVVDEEIQHLPRRALHRAAQAREDAAAHPAAEAAPGAGLLHRRHQRAFGAARPRAAAPGPHGPPHLLPHADEVDRLDIFDLYLGKVDHVPELDSEKRRDELARITNGYSPAMIEQVCSMALTYAHSDGREEFEWADLVEAITTVEAGTAQNVEYAPDQSRATAIHEAGHAIASHIYISDADHTRLSIRKRGRSLGHYQLMQKEERVEGVAFRHEEIAELVMILGAMAAEHVFYGENSTGVGGDVSR